MSTLLTVNDVDARYGASQVLFGTTLAIETGQVVTLMGRNGMGKSTLIKTILGLLPLRGGNIEMLGRSIGGWPSYRIARLGVGWVPEGRHVFPLLNVEENLIATARSGPGRQIWTLPEVYELFPILRERARQKSTTLSGGEQQMLAIGRALMTNPTLLILDEATEGLAPLIRAEIWRCVRRLKEQKMSILIVDKNLEELLPVADCHFVLEKGRVVWSGNSAQIRADPQVVENYLGV